MEYQEICFFIFSYSMLDVGRWMFDVHFFHSVLGKNSLAIMRWDPFPSLPYNLYQYPLSAPPVKLPIKNLLPPAKV